MFSKENLIKNSHTLKHNGSQKLQPKLDTITQSVLCSKQVSAVADEHARRAAPRQTCCKQRWTLSVINLRPTQLTTLMTIDVFELCELFVESCQF